MSRTIRVGNLPKSRRLKVANSHHGNGKESEAAGEVCRLPTEVREKCIKNKNLRLHADNEEIGPL